MNKVIVIKNNKYVGKVVNCDEKQEKEYKNNLYIYEQEQENKRLELIARVEKLENKVLELEKEIRVLKGLE